MPAGMRERVFDWSLIAAAVLHAALLFFAYHAKPRVIGQENGSTDPIAVSLISDEQFREQNSLPSVAEPPPAPTAPPTPPSPPVEATPPPPPPPPQAEPTPEPPPPDLKPTQAAEPDPKPEAKDFKTTIDRDDPALLALPDPAAEAKKRESAKKAETKAQPPAQPKQDQQNQKVAKLEQPDSPPSPRSLPSLSGSRYAGATRPPGITRSGQNDDFARKVVAALQATMPPSRGNKDRITIEIHLNDNGNLVSVKVLAPGRDPRLTQEVEFAPRQTSFPFPPPNSNNADKTFFITYVYDVR